MHTAYLVITIFFAAIVAFSGVGKIRRDAHQVRVIHETVGVPLKFFPLLAVGEFAGALGLLAGSGWPPLEHIIPAAKGRTRKLGEAARVDEPFDR